MDTLATTIASDGILIRTYNVDRLNDTSLQLIIDEIYDSLVEEVINVTILCHVTCVQKVLQKVYLSCWEGK